MAIHFSILAWRIPWSGTWLATVCRVAESEHACTYMSIGLLMPSNHFTLCCPRPLLLLASVFPSIRVSFSELALHIRWPEYWSFSISPSSECSGLISFRIGWFDLFAVQRTLKSLLQLHNSKASILQCSAFFVCSIVRFVHHYWENRSFDYTDLCQQNDVSAF